VARRFPSIRVTPSAKKERRRDNQKRQQQRGKSDGAFPRCQGNTIDVSFGGSLERGWAGGSKPGSASSAEEERRARKVGSHHWPHSINENECGFSK
jgi:hypothetical protein